MYVCVYVYGNTTTPNALHPLLQPKQTTDPPSEAEDDAVLRHSGEGLKGQRNVNLAYGMTRYVCLLLCIYYVYRPA